MQNKLQIYLTAPDKNVLSQCVIIKTPNNKIVVVDGGHLEFEPCLAPAIRGILGLKDDEYFEYEWANSGFDVNDPRGDRGSLQGIRATRLSREADFYLSLARGLACGNVHLTQGLPCTSCRGNRGQASPCGGKTGLGDRRDGQISLPSF